ncbi:hypothetical protein KP509_05G068400 [Ceratopteris richardii]|uniref:QWRF motif-containing protein 3 n=1 Tax=Ceratopteris richardii TaxID=49495 RepID=A0A8T2UTZ9_CERRI|nr:hypothetical protein KP509_05G068400 [Ceratopteris richardii]KAH7437376.1 hypothetical protein KP509_05G068400 [Ceratopteris richardii]
MSEVASEKLTSLLLTPQHVSNEQSDDKSRTTSVRRPRNREVTSRYKSSITQAASSRRCLNSTAGGDKLISASDLPSPRWNQVSERRHQSPLRTAEIKVANGYHDASLKSNADMYSVPKRSNVRTDLSLPPSNRTIANPAQSESQSQTSCPVPKKNGFAGKEINNVAEQPLRPTQITGQRRTLEPKSTLFQNSDESENTQPQENSSKLDLNRWHGGNSKTFNAAALSKSVDLSVDRGRSLNKPGALLVQSKPIYGSSRAPCPISSSRTLSYFKNEGQGFGIEFIKGKSENRGSRDSHCVATDSRGSNRDSIEIQANTCVNDLQSFKREMEAVADSACFDVSTSNIVSETDSSLGTAGASLLRNSAVDNREARFIRGTHVPARFLQDALNRSVRAAQKNNMRSSMMESELSVASSRRPGIKPIIPMSPETHLDCGLSFNEAPSPPWVTLVAPQQPLSLPRSSIYTRRTPSPGRSRVPLPSLQTQGQRHSSAAVSLNFGGDIVKRGKRTLMQADDTHLHRTLHNRLLQWRFINAKAEAVMDAQSLEAQKSLYNVCAKIIELKESTTVKKIQLGKVKQAEKLDALVQAQSPALQAWCDLQQDHSLALAGAIRALEAATVQVPVMGTVKADTVAVKEALESAVGVMNSVENSVDYLFPKAEETHLLMSEVARVVAQERNLLNECADLVAKASALQMEECSLRAHIVQMDRERAAFVRGQQALSSAPC